MGSQNPLVSLKASDLCFQSVSKTVFLQVFSTYAPPELSDPAMTRTRFTMLVDTKAASLFNQLDIAVIQKQALNVNLCNIPVCRYLAVLARSEEW